MSEYEKLAIVISIFALVTSFLALGWNIYRDVILKPRLKVRLMLSFIAHGEYESPTKISITATNFGPNKIICSSISGKNATLWRRVSRKIAYAFIVHDYKDPYSSKLPCELSVGEKCNLFLSFDKKCFLSEPLTHIGITDSFGRTHWAPKKDVVKLRKEYKKKICPK